MLSKKKSSILPILMIAAGVVLLFATGVIVLIPDLVGEQNPDEEYTQEIYTQVARLNPAQAKEAYDANAAVFVDVRDSAYFQSSHIPGARSIPLNQIEARYTELDTNDWIILYCT